MKCRNSGIIYFVQLVLSLVLIVPGFVAGQQAPPLPGDSLIQSGIYHMYNYQRRQALKDFKSVIAQYPDHPAGYFLQGVAKWMLVRGTEGLHPSEDTLLARMRRSADVAQTYTKAQQKDEYGWLLYGMALGVRARVDLARGHWVNAAIHGYKGILQVKKAQRLNPELPDLHIALGAFHYYVDMAGSLTRVAAGLIGLSGTRDEGKRELHYAVEHSRYATPEAKSILMYVYGYLEDDVTSALEHAVQLSRSYPDSPYYWTLRADFEIALNDTAAAKISHRKLKELLGHLDPFYQEEYQNKDIYLQGLFHFKRGEYARSVELLHKYILNNIDEYDFHSLNAEIIIARCYLALGDKEKSQGYLEDVTRDDIPSRFRSEARKLMAQIKK